MFFSALVPRLHLIFLRRGRKCSERVIKKPLGVPHASPEPSNEQVSVNKQLSVYPEQAEGR